MVDGQRLSGEAQLQMPELAEGEVESRRRWKRFSRRDFALIGFLAALWLGWLAWSWLG